MSAGDAVRVERQGPVTTVILHRPEARNAVDRPAAEALAWGLVHRGVPAADLDAETRTLARELASHATSTLATTKAMLRRLRAARRPAPGDCDDLIAACYASADFREGVAAFAARRPPAFS